MQRSMTCTSSEAYVGTTNTGQSNSAVGYNALVSITSGTANVVMGESAGSGNLGGSNNVFLGLNAGGTNTSGLGNICVGSNANVGSSSLTHAIAIGTGASVTTNSTMILGQDFINVGIGYNGASLVTNAKFNVKTTGATITNTDSYGIHSINANTHNGSVAFPVAYAYGFGVYGECTGSSNTMGYNNGGRFKATGGQNCVGVLGITQAPGGSSALLSYGGYFNASYTSTSTTGNAYGVVAYASSGASNYGIYASVSNVTGNYAGYFAGDVYVNGVNSGTGYLTVSDQAFKKSINTISNPLAIVNQLKPKSYYYKTDNAQGLRFSQQKQYGFIAQDLLTVLPELVHTVKKSAERDTSGKIIYKDTTHLAVDYDGFIALLAAGMQQQQQQIKALDSVNQILQSQINKCCNSGSRTNIGTGGLTPDENNNPTSPGDNKNASINVELSDANVIVLNQNVPNPFAEQTAITYNIPKNTGFAQILFYDGNGRLIKSVDIAKKGQGSLNVFANDLSSGTYSYNLVIDGKIYDTKKMVKQ